MAWGAVEQPSVGKGLLPGHLPFSEAVASPQGH